jgi:hypothetical protein
VTATTDPVELLREVAKFVGVHREASRAHPLWSRVFAAVDAAPASVDDLVAKLDTRCAESGERWDVYRTGNGNEATGWRAHAHARGESDVADPAAVGFKAVSLPEALAGLLATPRLPVIPRRPRPCAGVLKVVKGDRAGRWEVHEDGRYVGERSTKRDATTAMDAYRERVRAEFEEWGTSWAAVVEHGVEGGDFYWKS